MFASTLGGQISWLIPFAAIALIGTLLLIGRQPGTDLARASRCLERPWLRAARSYPDVAGSGDEQASAKLCCVEIDEVAVAFGPPTGCEVITEAVHCPPPVKCRHHPVRMIPYRGGQAWSCPAP